MQENKGKVSILIPVYNTESYLDRCIRSIQRQTYVNWELILVDDGSTDRSYSICSDYAAQDQRIRVLHVGHRGISEARNSGLSELRGEFVLIMDSDDWIEANYLEVMTSEIGSDSVIMSHYYEEHEAGADARTCGRRKCEAAGRDVNREGHENKPAGRDVNREGYENKPAGRDVNREEHVNKPAGRIVIKPGEKLKSEYVGADVYYPLLGTMTALWNKLFRVELLRDMKFEAHMSYGEDAYFLSLLSKRIQRIRILPEAYYHYQIARPGNILSAPISERNLEYLDTSLRILDEISADGQNAVGIEKVVRVVRGILSRVAENRGGNGKCGRNWKHGGTANCGGDMNRGRNRNRCEGNRRYMANCKAALRKAAGYGSWTYILDPRFPLRNKLIFLVGMISPGLLVLFKRHGF